MSTISATHGRIQKLQHAAARTATRELSSPLGTLTIKASSEGVQSITLGHRERAVTGDRATEKLLDRTQKELSEYFAGERTDFSVPLELSGTKFQKRVWSALKKIPFGVTLTYGELAKKLKVQSPRAVGQAVGANPTCVIVPCHRIVAANGLGGFAYGLAAKRLLLAREDKRLTK